MSFVHSAAACVHPRNLLQWNRFLASMSGSATYRWNIRQRSKLVPFVFPYCGQESVDRDTDSEDWEYLLVSFRVPDEAWYLFASLIIIA
eukprot:g46007.t1